VTWLSDAAITRLRDAADRPDFSGTRYDVGEVLGRGGMGAVYRGTDNELGREVAIKVVAPWQTEDAAVRLAQEARVLARLEHPGIVPVHDIGTLPDGRLFYVMKLVRGAPLDRAAAGLLLGDRLRLFARACEAVGFAHAHGIVHRDLKPTNIMVASHGEVLVVDWGLARLLEPAPSGLLANRAARDATRAATPAGTVLRPGESPTRTAHGRVLGTPGFMAPEQARGEVMAVDQRSDVYALGAVLQSLLECGGDAAPAALRSIAARARSEDPHARYASARELAEELVRFTAGLAVHAHHETALERTVRLVSRYKTPILLVLAYLLMRVLLAVFTR
jgi:serine/threonine protein kinase